ncbi:MAG: DUF3047 domain-containing protein [Wenzhouxiangella sp.]
MRYSFRKMISVGSAALFLVLPAAATDDALRFEPAAIVEWESESFSGHTQYSLVEVDGRPAVHAECNKAASGLWLRREIDLVKYPILEWSWRVDETFQDIDESSRAGDDYPARLYVIMDGGWLRLRTRAVNYVWASEKPVGADWPNAYTSRARMLAVQSGPPDAPGTWRTQRRNLREDFRALHNRDPEKIDAIALMTDCDDTGGTAEAWYGEIRFLPEQLD